MTIQLTEEQKRAVMMGQTVRLTVPEVGGDVMMVRAEQSVEEPGATGVDAPRGISAMVSPFLRGFASILDVFSPPQFCSPAENEGQKLQADWDRIVADMQRGQSQLKLPAVDVSVES